MGVMATKFRRGEPCFFKMKSAPAQWLLFLLTLLGTASKTGRTALRPPDQNDDGAATSYGYRGYPLYLTSEMTHTQPFPMYSVKEQPRGFTKSKSLNGKLRLAAAMKAHFHQFRDSLAAKTSEPEREPVSVPWPVVTHPAGPSLVGRKEPILVSFQSQGASALSVVSNKNLRSADEAASTLRSSGIRPEAHPFAPQPWLTAGITVNETREDMAEETSDQELLERRLGPLAPPSFDPSIVVDFFKLLQLTRQTQGQGLEKLQTSSRKDVQASNQPPNPTIIMKSAIKSSEGNKPIRRRLPGIEEVKVVEVTQAEIPTSKTVEKRARYLEKPYRFQLNSQNGTIHHEDLSLYVSSKMHPNPTTGKEEFGLFSQGNDPNAGIHPSEVKVPDLDLQQLPLPQGVRDSLRKYLKPIISALKPLRKSVPGLPGLDYPILSVVPYTNFYCSNMPWPGFYADTEARCQTWHACDVDGRQATFLCPNGTIFNQALMVCDWWYNTDCLISPFLYPLNERLFGAAKPPPVHPYNRLTPQLLDTIFV